MANQHPFKPCCTCRYDLRTKEKAAFCGMFGWMGTAEARSSDTLCGRHGEAWEPKPVQPNDYAPTPMAERILG